MGALLLDPNREAVGLEPIWTRTDDNTPKATGATAGTPGSFTPPGTDPPFDLAGMHTITATPSTPWTTGQSVILGDGSRSCWSGSDWVGGIAP